MQWLTEEQLSSIRKVFERAGIEFSLTDEVIGNLTDLFNRLLERIEKLESEVEAHQRIIDYRLCDPKKR